MTKTMRIALAGLVIGVAVQPLAYSEEKVGQPFRFSVGTHATFTDNRDSVKVNKQSNTDIFVSPRVDYVFNDGKNQFRLFYVPSFRYRTDAGDNGDSTAWHHNFGMKGTLAVTERSRIRFTEKYDYNDDSAIKVGGAVVRGNHTYGENTALLGFNTDLYKYSNLDFSIKNNVKRFSDDVIAKTSDENITTVDAAHRYQITQTLRSVLGATYGLYSYDNSLNRDFYSLTGTVGLENDFTPTTMGSVRVGYQNANYDDSSVDSKNEPYAKVAISSQTGADLNIGASVEHGIRDTDAYPFTSQVYSEFGLFGHLDITPSLALHGTGIYRKSEYDKEDIPAAARGINFVGKNGGDDTTIVLDAMLDYSIVENLSLYIGYRYEDIDSEVGQSYTKNSGRLGAALNF